MKTNRAAAIVVARSPASAPVATATALTIASSNDSIPHHASRPAVAERRCGCGAGQKGKTGGLGCEHAGAVETEPTEAEETKQDEGNIVAGRACCQDR